jgi:hypothetical protein
MPNRSQKITFADIRDWVCADCYHCSHCKRMGADLWPDGTGLIRRPVEALAEGQEPAAPGAEQGDGGVRVTFINVMSASHWKRLNCCRAAK